MQEIKKTIHEVPYTIAFVQNLETRSFKSVNPDDLFSFNQ